MYCKNGMVKSYGNSKKKLAKIRKQVLVYIYIQYLWQRTFYYMTNPCTCWRRSKQHLELSRDIAQKFNDSAPDFKAPEPLIQKILQEFMSLKEQKKWQIDPSDLSRINLTDKKRNSKKIKRLKLIIQYLRW